MKSVKNISSVGSLTERISTHKDVCNGRPVVRGLRITVQTVLEFLLAGTSEAEILAQYPVLERADIEACKLFTLSLLEQNFTTRDLEFNMHLRKAK